MSIVHVRDLAKFGIVTDPDSYDLPTGAFSRGVNARFRNGRVTRAPVFRNVKALGTQFPRFLCATNPSSGLDLLFVGYKNGRIYKFDSGVETDYSVSGFVNNSSDATWSTTNLADVLYINREDRVPWYLRTSDTSFQTLPAWSANDRAKILRSCGGALVALNVTKSGTNYPTMVKTSSFPTAGTVPSSWDFSDPATLATENILAKMRGPIIDAQGFGNSLMIYGLQETWLMQADDSFSVFRYTKLPFQKGAINANCSLEVGGRHVVFGLDDIWAHDGITETSLCDQRTRDFIFNSINLSKANRCFVSHNAKLKEVHFCYVSGDALSSFQSGDGCNRQAVWDYSTNTWTFDDLPYVFSADCANLDVTLTYASALESYATIGGTYQDQEDSFKRSVVYVGESNSTYALSTSLYAFDLYGEGSTIAFGVDVNATKALYLERDGIDLDEVGADLRGYKTVSAIYPQARVDADAAPITFTFGTSDYFGQPAVFGAPQSYDGSEKYKLDYNAAGRYLSLRISFNDYKSMSLSGFDLDMSVTGNR